MTDQNEHDECAAAAKRRLEALIYAFDADPDYKASMKELWLADRRLSEQCVYLLSTKRPDLMRRGLTSGYIPERKDGGPTTAAQALLWNLCARYEVTANLLEVYVGDERVFTDHVSNLRQNAPYN
jgi:hypothetical protein